MEEIASSREEQQAELAAPRWRTWTFQSHLWASGLLIVALLSALVLAPAASSPAAVVDVRESLDEQQNQVLTLAAGATALSAVLSAVPGDAMTPIANQLADLTGWFMVVIGALILQKMLFTSAGSIAFAFIVPVACASAIVFVYSGRRAWRTVAIRLAAFAAILFAAVPASIMVSDAITNEYTDLATAAQQVDTEVDLPASASEDTTSEPVPSAGANPAEGGSLLDRLGGWVSDTVDSVGNWASGVGDSIAGSVTDFRDEAVQELNNYIEHIALLTITTCVMPLLVMLLFAWVIRQLFGVNLGVDRVGHQVRQTTAGAVRYGNRQVSSLGRGGTGDKRDRA